MNNKKLLLIIALIIVSPVLLILLFISLRIWPIWLLFIIIALVVVFNKKMEIPGNENGQVKTSINNFLQKLSILINSPAYRSFTRKLLLYPIIGILLIAALSVGLEFLFSDYLKGRSTKKEMIEITDGLSKYQYHEKQFPESLQDLIGNNPLKKEWTSDKWDRQFRYKLSIDKQNFTLSSAGKDGIVGNEDDINFDKEGEIKQK